MTHELEKTVALLARTPDVLNSLLRELPETWTLANEGDGTWTPFDVVAHLIHGEHENWIPRARVILEFGESHPIPPFDRTGNFGQSRLATLEQLLDEFAMARAASLEHLRALNLQPQDMTKRGLHPVLGVVTLSELLAAWGAHDLTHLHQITRILARQYCEAVGPFSKFIGVLHCTGHGA